MNNQPAYDSTIKNFLLTGKIEGYSYLILLFIAMPLKYVYDLPIYVRIAGAVHGFLFVVFVITILLMLRKKHFDLENGIYAFLLSLVPFGTFFLKRLL